MKIPVLLLTVLLTLSALLACGGGNSAPPAAPSPGAPNNLPTSGASKNQIVVTGTVNQTYTVDKVFANKMPGDIRIDIPLGILCSVFLNIPFETQPGAYPFATESKSDVFFAQYNDTCNTTDSYPSASGTLTLTSTGEKLSQRNSCHRVPQ